MLNLEKHLALKRFGAEMAILVALCWPANVFLSLPTSRAQLWAMYYLIEDNHWMLWGWSWAFSVLIGGYYLEHGDWIRVACFDRLFVGLTMFCCAGFLYKTRIEDKVSSFFMAVFSVTRMCWPCCLLRMERGVPAYLPGCFSIFSFLHFMQTFQDEVKYRFLK